MEQRISDNEVSKRDIASFIEPRPPLISNPFMRPRPQQATNLLQTFEEDIELEEPDLVQVYLRMKPHDGPNNMYEVRNEKCLVTSLDTTTAGHGRRTQHNVSRMYTFSRIFEANCTQKEIFDEVVKENLKKLVDGQSFTLLTYGASGSGKTYTLMGSVSAPGLVPRSLEYVFKLVDAAQTPFYKPSDSGAELLGFHQQEFELQWVKKLRQISAPVRDKYRRMSAQLHGDLTVSNINLANRTQHYVWVSFVEIYNEAIYDLLAPPDKRVKLRMREDSSGQVYVKGAAQAFVRSGAEAYDVMVAGKHNLVVAATGVHAHSSRSHCIFTITMLTETEGKIRTSCVRLCDLAGCERARATRNTGARMQESRAINSSLHVLERCLHMLRSKQKQRQEALVPYRESKLTRLLGSGLSGSRGEAVSMVVTLNPAPQYAQETKHVLSLAAVAKDLQINNTAMFASSLESSAQETTVNSTIWNSSEVQQLKSKLELLHFELLQAESRNKELQAMMEEKQEIAADTMREMVEEAKDITRQYYETQLAASTNEMEEMVEEYEARLAKCENKLLEATEARARLEEEVKHLWACLHERDEKSSKDPETPNLEDIVVTDSEDERNDPLNQSLEPSFKKECMKRPQAVAITNYIHKTGNNHIKESDESTDTIKQETSKNSDYETSDERDLSRSKGKIEFNQCSFPDLVNDKLEPINMLDTHTNISRDTTISYLQNDPHESTSNVIKNEVRGTYFVRKSSVMGVNKKVDDDKGTEDLEADSPKDIYFTRTSAIDTSIDEEIQEIVENKTTAHEIATENQSEDILPPTKVSENLVNKILQSLKKSTNSNTSDCSLRQFEQLEKASQECKDETVGQNFFGDIKMLKEKKNFFPSDNLHVSVKPDETEMLISCYRNKDAFEETLDMKKATIQSCKNMEIVKDIERIKINEVEKLTTTPILQQRSYFDNLEVTEIAPNRIASEIISTNEAEKLIKTPVLQKRSYFDNLEVTKTAPNKMVAEIISSVSKKNYDRSPSIVLGDSEPFEPSTIKKLLGDNIAKLEVLSAINKPAKQQSIDVFEVFESPQVKPKETATITGNKQETKTLLSVDETEQKFIQKIPKITVNLEDKKPAEQNETYKNDNTIDEFENIYKNLSTQRPTEFDLLTTTQEIDANNKKNDVTDDVFAEPESDKENMQKKSNELAIGLKYNLRHKYKPGDTNEKTGEALLVSTAKSESKKNKRSLRLRRRKNEDENADFEDKWDMVNLKKEFSDVTLGLPVTQKVVKDIPSPEKLPGEENPPLMGIQSCPSKSIPQSRRKLFTPRAEPLEESSSQAGDSSERIHVPRPSYHRTRTRRKL